MTDTELKRRKAICEAAHVDEIDDVSDGFHTFRQLYYQRMMLFAAIVKQNKDKAWKSLRHEDGELCFGGGWFIVGIDTPEGSYTYHYEDNYFSLFDCEELEYGKHWDGHTEKDVTRLLSLPSAQPKERTEERMETHACDCISRQAALNACKNPEDGENAYAFGDDIQKRIKALPAAQPERTCVNCGRTVNNGGWYADGRTRCPIEEHYALPKDGYCHLWEKRNVTDDDYPERRTDEPEK